MEPGQHAGRGGASRVVIALISIALAVMLWRALTPGAPHGPFGAGRPGVAGGPGRTSGPLSAADSAGSDADIERALVLARAAAPPAPSPAAAPPADSSAIKNAWHDDVRGVDLAGLEPAQREILLRFANAEHCTCGCGYTLAGCLASDMTCEISRGSIATLLDSIRAGRITSARGVRKRPPAGG